MPVNGQNFEFEDIKVMLAGAPLVEITEINYSDEREVEEQYGTGSYPIAIGRGNYKGSGDLTLRRNEYDKLRAIAVGAGRNLFEMNPFPIVISYGGKVEGSDGFTEAEYSPTHVETLMNCVFSKRDFSAKQNDKGNTVKLGFVFIPPVKLG